MQRRTNSETEAATNPSATHRRTYKFREFYLRYCGREWGRILSAVSKAIIIPMYIKFARDYLRTGGSYAG